MKALLGMLMLVLMVTGCGGGDSGPSVDVSGTWRAVSTNGEVSTLVLHQDANGVVTGRADDLTVTGSVDGDRLSLGNAPLPMFNITETIFAKVSGNSMSGTYEIRGDVNASGTFTATR